MRHSANLDILRAFAVTTVLVDHLIPTLQAHSGSSNQAVFAFTAQIGHAGVLAFFVHTSLVLMYSLERTQTTVARFTKKFYIRRFFRIYPLAIFSIILALTFHIREDVWHEFPHMTPAIIVSNLLLVQNIFTKVAVLGPLWTLPYEVQMYLVLPFLFLLARIKKGPEYLFGLLAFFWLVGFLLGYKTGHLNMAAYIPCFLSGVLCYSLRNRSKALVPAVLWTPFVILLISVYCLANTHRGHTWLSQTPTFWTGWIFSLVLGLSINTFKDSQAQAGNFVANKVALYSYGMYLLHVPVLYLLFVRIQMQNLAVAIPLFFLLTVAASIITFHTIESPFIELGRKLSSGRKVSAEAKMAPVMPAP